MRENIALDQTQRDLRRFAAGLLGGSIVPGFRERSQVERDLFVSCKIVAAKFLHFDLHGFSLKARMEIEEAMAGQNIPTEVPALIRRGFELKAALSTLMSGNPYVSGEILREFNDGRREAFRAFGLGVKSFVGLLTAIRAVAR